MSDIPDWVSKPPLSPTEELRYRGTHAPSPSSILSPPEPYDSHPDYLRIKKMHDALPWRDHNKCEQHTYSVLRQIANRSRIPTTIIDHLYEAIFSIFEAEGFYKPYLRDWSPSDSRRYLQRKELFYRTFDRRMVAAEEKIVEYFAAFINHAPSAVFADLEEEKEFPGVSLAVLHPRAVEFAAWGFSQFMTATDPTDSEQRLFPKLSRALMENLFTASGYRLEMVESGRVKNPKLIGPLDSKLDPPQLCAAYLHDTPLLRVFTAVVPFLLPDEARFAGHWIIAPPGRGKTVLLSSMFVDDLSRNASIIVMDSKGDLIEPIKKLQAIRDRVVLIEPDLDFPLALNPLDIPKASVAHTISLLEYVMSSLLEAKMTALQTALFRKLLPAFIAVVPHPTLEAFKDVLLNGMHRYTEQLASLDTDIRQFFLDKQHGFDSKTYAETRNQLVWRLDFLLSNPILKAMFASVKTKLDIGKEMDAGKIILINNSKALLGDEGAEFFGRFFIALILAAAQQRAGRHPDHKLPVYCYIDECHNVIARDPKIATILDECRSQKIALILAHQRSAQLTPPVLDAVANCAIRFANSDDEAKFLADKLRTTADFLHSLPRGTFAAFVRDLTPHALALEVPYVDLSKLPHLTAAEQQEIRERMRQEFSFTPEPRPAAAAPRADAPVKRSQAKRPLDQPEPANPTSPPPSSPGADAPERDPHTGDHAEPAPKWGD